MPAVPCASGYANCGALPLSRHVRAPYARMYVRLHEPRLLCPAVPSSWPKGFMSPSLSNVYAVRHLSLSLSLSLLLPLPPSLPPSLPACKFQTSFMINDGPLLEDSRQGAVFPA